MKPTIYIETSVVSYLTSRPSRDLIVAGHQQITREWWNAVHPKVDCFVSPFVIQELNRGNQEAAQKRLAAIEGFSNLLLNENIKVLAQRYFVATSYSTTKTMLKEVILSFKAPEPVGPYPHARRAGNLLFLSGIGPRERGAKKTPGVELDENGEVISHDIEAQCHAVFRNVKYVLEEAGSDWDRIIDVTVFLTDMKKDFATFNRIYAQYFTGNQPSRTTVEVNCLPTPIAIELKVIAVIE